ncbi:MAG: MG2 domain-containing protein, partial [Pseudomonadota bacterium]
MILRLVSALSLIAVAASATFAVAQTSPVPDRRIVTEIGQDYYGGDIGSIFDTTFGKCRAACMRNPDCQALTFNSRAGACFLKSELERKTPYDGAISAQMVKTSDAVRALAQTRVKDLDFLPSGFIDEARELAATLGARSATNGRSWEDLRAAAIAADRAGQKDQAARGFGAAVTLSDDPDTWRDLARVWRDMPGEDARARRRLRRDAVSAAINAYLRSEDDAARATALNLLARALEDRGYGREMIPALRLSQALSPRERTEEQLFSAISRFGFRVTEHSVDSDAASPRICVQFSEPLAEAGVDYGSYVRVEGQADLPVEAEGAQLCVEGIVHGERYKLAVREGLPSGAGDTLRRSHEITVYVRDRAPSVRFVGRNYVLPRGADAAIPVVTVNLTEVELQIHRIGDRNLLPIIQDDLFDQALNKWTETRLADRTGAAIWSGTGEVSGPVNADVMTALPIGEAIQDAAPGVYAMTARVPGDTSQWDRAPTQWFIVTDLGLAAMSGADGVHGFVRALSSAAPEEGITVQLIARNNEVLGEAVTDDQGYVRFPPGLARGTGGAAPALLTAAVEGDFAFLDLAKPGFDLSDRGVEGRDAPGPIDVFATTERGVYRPGEVVHTTILARDARAQAIRDLPLTAIITRPDGVEYHRAQIDDQGNGGRSHTMRLGSGVPRGTWKMKIHADPDAAPIRQIAFLVEDFVPEKIDFDLTAPEGPVVPEDGLTVSLNARYLYGAPGADLTVDGSVKVTPTDTIAGFPGFRFGLHDEQVNTALETAPQITTNANGDASLQLAIPNSAAETRPIEMTAIVHVTDSSGRPVERTLTRPLAPAGGRIGIRPLFDGAAEEGGNAGFEIIAVGPDGQIALDRVGWTLSRINRRWQWYELNGRWNYEAVTSRERVANGEIVLTADGRASIEAPVQWGRYELKLQTLEGDYAAASHAFDAGWYSAGGSSDTPDVLEIGLDKPAYRIGDEVRVRLKPRVAGKVLLSVVDNRLIEMTTLDVEPGETETTLTVTEAWGAGAYITATLIRPMDVAAKRNPSRALGLAWATVDPAERALEVEITTPDEVQPRGPMEAAVRIAGLSGETAHVTLAAVDLGILNLTGFAPPAPGDHYFGQRALGIEMRDVYGRLIDGLQGARGRIRSGGDAEAARLKAPPPTEDLVAFHSGVVEVGADGTASVRFALPEFNGTVRIMAVAWSGKGVGHAHKDVLVRDPVVVSAATPRFLAPGDSTRVLLDIAHAKGSAGAVTTRITGDGGISIA